MREQQQTLLSEISNQREQNFEPQVYLCDDKIVLTEYNLTDATKEHETEVHFL